MAWYTVDEAKVNIDWALEQVLLRRNQEKYDLAEQLYNLVTEYFDELGAEKAAYYYDQCNKAGVDKLKKLKEEIINHYKIQAA